MKKMIAALSLSGVLVGGVAHAAAFTPAQLHDSAQKAVTKFETDHPLEVAGFVGYKVWRSADMAKVKVYVTLNGVNSDRNYYCEDHGDPDGIECHD